jgi:arylsulfatase A
VPLYVSEKHRGSTAGGLFGDVIAEIDWSVGEIVAAVDRHGLADRTLVMFSADNGPWLSYGDHAGTAGSLREGKGTAFDGGVRVPFLARWPGHVPAGAVCREPAMTIDLLPTLAGLAGGELPRQQIDGLDIGPLLIGAPQAESPHEAFYFYWGRELQAVRSDRWKLHFPHAYRSLQGAAGAGGQPARYVERRIELALFDLAADPGETTDVSRENAAVVERLRALAEAARADLGDSATGQPGAGVRSAGM